MDFYFSYKYHKLLNFHIFLLISLPQFIDRWNLKKKQNINTVTFFYDDIKIVMLSRLTLLCHL